MLVNPRVLLVILLVLLIVLVMFTTKAFDDACLRGRTVC